MKKPEKTEAFTQSVAQKAFTNAEMPGFPVFGAVLNPAIGSDYRFLRVFSSIHTVTDFVNPDKQTFGASTKRPLNRQECLPITPSIRRKPTAN